MSRFSHVVACGFTLLALAACGSPPAPPPAPAAMATLPSERLSRIVENYWNEHMALGNAISPQFLADSLAVERRFLAEVLALPRGSLDANSKLTYDIFIWRRQLSIEGFTYPSELLPVNPFDAMPEQLARMAAATLQQPFKTPADYERWLRRIDRYVRWTQQAIGNMRDGMRRGYTTPRPLVERMLPLLERLGEDTSANVFYVPMRTMPETIKDPERTRLGARLGSATKDKLLPAYRALHDFLQHEYLPRARTSLALTALPMGPSWYAYRIKRATGSLLTPNQIHSIGLAAVESIRVRMQPLLTGAPLAGAGAGAGAGGMRTAPNADGGELLNAYRDLKAQTLAALPTLFSAVPHSDFEIRPMAAFGEAETPLYYQPASPGGTADILYVNVGTVAARPTVVISDFLQQALPGHHLQFALQQERSDLPLFRRYGNEPAFVQGWGLYAASLGEELGLYRDDETKLGALLGQMRCAVTLVVDTGLHAKGWTRAQALDYLRAQLAVDDTAANLLIDRYVAMPGDALACKLGELKFQALRTRAQQVLGAQFDIREFHTEILKDGAMPLDILEAKMQAWMDAKR